jgi:uncharacterized protein DUF551
LNLNQHRLLIGCLYRRNRMWISVDDRLPDFYQEVLAFDGENYWISILSRNGKEGCFRSFQCEGCNIYYEGLTHWMPLPKPPAEAASPASPANQARDVSNSHHDDPFPSDDDQVPCHLSPSACSPSVQSGRDRALEALLEP